MWRTCFSKTSRNSKRGTRRSPVAIGTGLAVQTSARASTFSSGTGASTKRGRYDANATGLERVDGRAPSVTIGPFLNPPHRCSVVFVVLQDLDIALGIATTAFAARPDMRAGALLSPFPSVRVMPCHQDDVAVISRRHWRTRLETLPWEERFSAHIVVDQ